MPILPRPLIIIKRSGSRPPCAHTSIAPPREVVEEIPSQDAAAAAAVVRRAPEYVGDVAIPGERFLKQKVSLQSTVSLFY